MSAAPDTAVGYSVHGRLYAGSRLILVPPEAPPPDPPVMVMRADVEAMLAKVMHRREYLAEEPCLVRTEGSGWHSVPLPPDKGLRLSDFLAELQQLPELCDEQDAAAAIIRVIRARGGSHLAREMDQLWPGGPLPHPEPDTAEDDLSQTGPGQLPAKHCAHCGTAFRPLHPTAVYDTQACRQKAYAARQAAKASSGT
jgi:hypothetical protein